MLLIKWSSIIWQEQSKSSLNLLVEIAVKNVNNVTDSVLKLLNEYSELPEFVGIDLNDVNRQGNFGNTPLHIAAGRGDISELRLLIEAGAYVDARGETGYSSLHEAASHGHKEIVRELLRRGADAQLVSDLGQTAKDLAMSLGEHETYELLQSWMLGHCL